MSLTRIKEIIQEIKESNQKLEAERVRNVHEQNTLMKEINDYGSYKSLLKLETLSTDLKIEALQNEYHLTLKRRAEISTKITEALQKINARIKARTSRIHHLSLQNIEEESSDEEMADDYTGELGDIDAKLASQEALLLEAKEASKTVKLKLETLEKDQLRIDSLHKRHEEISARQEYIKNQQQDLHKRLLGQRNDRDKTRIEKLKQVLKRSFGETEIVEVKRQKFSEEEKETADVVMPDAKIEFGVTLKFQHIDFFYGQSQFNPAIRNLIHQIQSEPNEGIIIHPGDLSKLLRQLIDYYAHVESHALNAETRAKSIFSLFLQSVFNDICANKEYGAPYKKKSLQPLIENEYFFFVNSTASSSEITLWTGGFDSRDTIFSALHRYGPGVDTLLSVINKFEVACRGKNTPAFQAMLKLQSAKGFSGLNDICLLMPVEIVQAWLAIAKEAFGGYQTAEFEEFLLTGSSLIESACRSLNSHTLTLLIEMALKVWGDVDHPKFKQFIDAPNAKGFTALYNMCTVAKYKLEFERRSDAAYKEMAKILIQAKADPDKAVANPFPGKKATSREAALVSWADIFPPVKKLTIDESKNKVHEPSIPSPASQAPSLFSPRSILKRSPTGAMASPFSQANTTNIDGQLEVMLNVCHTLMNEIFKLNPERIHIAYLAFKTAKYYEYVGSVASDAAKKKDTKVLACTPKGTPWISIGKDLIDFAHCIHTHTESGKKLQNTIWETLKLDVSKIPEANKVVRSRKEFPKLFEEQIRMLAVLNPQDFTVKVVGLFEYVSRCLGKLGQDSHEKLKLLKNCFDQSLQTLKATPEPLRMLTH